MPDGEKEEKEGRERRRRIGVKRRENRDRVKEMTNEGHKRGGGGGECGEGRGGRGCMGVESRKIQQRE